jgi:putative membrane protein
MAFDVRLLAFINLAVQLLLIITISIAAYLAKKKQLKTHCTIMRVAVPIQITAILGVMLPSMLGYIENEQPDTLLNIEILAHHGLGIVVVLLWIYVNLVYMGVMKMWGRPVMAMRLALVLWVLTFVMGLHLYALIWI